MRKQTFMTTGSNQYVIITCPLLKSRNNTTFRWNIVYSPVDEGKLFLTGKNNQLLKDHGDHVGVGITFGNQHWNNYQARIITDAKTTGGKTVEEMYILIMPKYHPTDYIVIAKWKIMFAMVIWQ